MSTTTTYLNLNKPTGSDLVNPLVDTFPNWDIVDSSYHNLDLQSIGTATELVSQGVHALTRLDQNTKTFKFIATGNYTAGETFTVDGIQCNAYTPGGTPLASNCYVTGSVVLVSLNADDSALTFYVTGSATSQDSERLGGELPSYYAAQSDMSDAETDITNLKNLAGNTSIAGIGNGTLTGAVSTLNTDLTANNLLSYVDLSSYNSFSNRYTFPSDGYLEIYAGGGGNVSCRIYGANATADTDTRLTLKEVTNETSKIINVKKEMSVYQYALTQTSWIRFYPLS